MLANPVVVPAYAHPMHWLIAVIAMLVEVAVTWRLLARFANGTAALQGPLFAINLTTWLSFLIAVQLADQAGLNLPLSIAVLEGIVILVEAVLLHSAMRGRLFTRDLGCRPITWQQALRVSFFGNLAAIATSLVVPALLFTLLTWGRR